MLPLWFKERSYLHFDTPVQASFTARVQDPVFVSRHSFSPLIHFEKITKRYKPDLRKVSLKKRPIMYAGHRDSCIYSFYSWMLASKLEQIYLEREISANVAAYRKLGKSNYHFSNEALEFARQIQPCMILAYDVTKFFDSLDHKLLKLKLRDALKCKELPSDWYAVLKNVTRFSHVNHTDLVGHQIFGERLRRRHHPVVATMAEMKTAGMPINKNKAGIGIPQGLPISSVLANLYMIDFDLQMAAHAREVGGFYRRYSDDIIFICDETHAVAAEAHIEAMLAAERLQFSDDKTERTFFSATNDAGAQYLGFRLHPTGASLRPASLSRQWRKMRRAVRQTAKVGSEAIASGVASKIYTKRLHRRFSSLPLRNFSSYGRRSAAVMSSKQILRQVRKLESEFKKLLQELT